MPYARLLEVGERVMEREVQEHKDKWQRTVFIARRFAPLSDDEKRNLSWLFDGQATQQSSQSQSKDWSKDEVMQEIMENENEVKDAEWEKVDPDGLI